MIEKVEIGDATLYCGDCLEILPTLGRVDCVVTDPPYGISHSSGWESSWQRTTIKDDEDTTARDAALIFAPAWAAFGSPMIGGPPGAKHKVIWDKGPASGMGDLSFPWKRSFEECWIAGEGWTGERRDEGVWRGPIQHTHESFGRAHPHQKPVWLLEKLIAARPSDETIADPFMGSGTTGVACANLGRKFVGIEIDRRYFDVACERITAAYAQGRLFA